MDTTVHPRDKNRDGDGTQFRMGRRIEMLFMLLGKLTKKQLAKIYKDFNLLETLFLNL